MEYPFREIELKWQTFWANQKTFKAVPDPSRPKYYVLDMFPYPSGSGLHVGHPLGYIASDIVSRYKRLLGFNVLHPMGYDAFGLPAEQYAVQTGQHPAITTAANIERYRTQLDRMGFSFDWDCEVRTCDPSFYKWTQWIFIQLFESWYNNDSNRAESLETLIRLFETQGSNGIKATHTSHQPFSASDWAHMKVSEKENILLNYRLAYLSDTQVNWCPQLGTVLANEEIKDGLSERGGFPVEKKLMKQWSLRITAYADRLLDDLEKIDWPDPVKEMQRNWIGRSEGASIWFEVPGHNKSVEVFSTRPDTLFGATFMVLAPEHELVQQITSPENETSVRQYIESVKGRSERERMTEVKRISGVFTGAFAEHPFTGDLLPVWIADYVLSGYGTGAVMAVPAHDSRDHAFALHFQLPIKQVVAGGDGLSAYEDKQGLMIDSDFMNGMNVAQAIHECIKVLERDSKGKGRVNYRLRDAIFSRQRYWGEPFPVYYRDGLPCMVSEDQLPLELPRVDAYLPTESGDPPLARASNWASPEGYPYETSTMPGWAGSSWYFLRYMDPANKDEFVSKKAVDYWHQVDLYIGGAEHATGHLLYVRFWTKFLFDSGFIPADEPARKLVNQGMIQGTSAFVYRINNTNTYVSKGLANQYETTALHVDVNMVRNGVLDTEAFLLWKPDLAGAKFILEEGKYFCGQEIEKMSKSKWNVVSPDDIIEKYGADTLRLYEMFLGPLELSKPWNTNGIEGVSKFIRKLWRLVHHQNGSFEISDDTPTPQEFKTLHKTIKKVQEDTERLSFNTSVSTFMICVNELTDLKCRKRAIIEPLTILISPFAPHIAEEIWSLLGFSRSITFATFPSFDERYLIEDTFEYPVSVNGKTKFKLEIPLSEDSNSVEKTILESDMLSKYLNGKSPRKVIVVHGRIINVVV